MPNNEDGWIEWASYNRAMNVDPDKIDRELRDAGFSTEDIERMNSTLASAPIFKAAQKLARNYKVACNLNDYLLKTEGLVYDFSEIRRVREPSKEAFLSNYYSTNRPVIIEGVVSKWPALDKWTIEYLNTAFGAHTIKYQMGRSPDDHRDCFIDHTVAGTLAEFISAIQAVPLHQEPPYLIAHDRILDRHEFRPLLQDLIFDDRYFDAKSIHSRVFFWLGPARSKTPLHRDLGNVYMAQIRGRKRIIMIPSKQLHLVYNEHGYHSEANFSSLMLDKFPLLKKAFIMEFVLNPGELLFIPAGWWHDVEALDTAITITGNNFVFPNDLALSDI